MRPPLFYRIASVLLLLFAALHTFGFRQVDPAWRADTVVSAMRSLHFDIMGSTRTYWDLFSGFGFLFSVFLVFTAVLAWQLGDLSDQTRALMRGTPWALAACFAAATLVSCWYAFIFPTVFSILILFCFATAAWLTPKSTRDATLNDRSDE